MLDIERMEFGSESTCLLSPGPSETVESSLGSTIYWDVIITKLGRDRADVDNTTARSDKRYNGLGDEYGALDIDVQYFRYLFRSDCQCLAKERYSGVIDYAL